MASVFCFVSVVKIEQLDGCHSLRWRRLGGGCSDYKSLVFVLDMLSVVLTSKRIRFVIIWMCECGIKGGQGWRYKFWSHNIV